VKINNRKSFKNKIIVSFAPKMLPPQWTRAGGSIATL